MSSHLFIALSTKGLGGTTLGLQIARALRRQGEDVAFLIHPSSEPLLQASSFDYMAINDHVGPMLPIYLSKLMATSKADDLFLSDLATTDLWLDRYGLSPETLLDFGLPIYAIDTWCIDITGTEMDIYWRSKRRFHNWSNQIDCLAQPSPLAPPQGTSNPYSAVPDPVASDASVGQALRKRLGLNTSDQIILFCTADWQQTRYRCTEAQRFSETLPHLLASYLRHLGSDVHLIHVGPRPYQLDLGERYHWISQLLPNDFAEILGGSDLLLTVNISSTTIAQAMISGVPVLAVINSFELETESDIDALPFELDVEDTAPWLRENLPLYRYYMWPVGFYDFLDPILRDGAYLNAIVTVELLHRELVVAAIDDLLWSSTRRTAVIEAQASYAATLRTLPSPTELLMNVS